MAGDGVRGIEAELLGHQLIEFPYLVVVAVEEGEERGLGAGGALDATATQARAEVLDVLHIHEQILRPQAGALAHGDQLRRLEMGKTERGQIAVLDGEGLEARQHGHRLGEHEFKRLADQDEIRIVTHVAARGAEVDDRFGRGRHLAEGMDVRHDVVARAAFVFERHLEVDVLEVLTHLVELRLGNVQAQFPLGFGQRQPAAAPCGELLLWTPQFFHGRRGDTFGQRTDVLRSHRCSAPWCVAVVRRRDPSACAGPPRRNTRVRPKILGAHCFWRSRASTCCGSSSATF